MATFTPTPEDRAKYFARRWLSQESARMQELGEKELAAIIREAVDAAGRRAENPVNGPN